MMEQTLYKKILVPVEGTKVDRTIIDHIIKIALIHKSSILFIHVADKWAARYYREDTSSKEVEEDKKYLDSLTSEIKAYGIEAKSVLAYGNPADAIIETVEKEGCDLIAMATHGHGEIFDILFGSTAHKVRHRVTVPVLFIKTK